MVRDPDDAVAEGSPPHLLRQPADAPPPLDHIGDDEALRTLRRVWPSRDAEGRRSLRAWAGRVSGRSDRRLLLALANATATLSTHCDLLVDRLTAQEAVTADVTGAFGQEITQLRAEVLHLQRQVASLHGPSS